LAVLLGVLVAGMAIGGLGQADAAPGANWARMLVSRAQDATRSAPVPVNQETQAGPWTLAVIEVVTGDDANALVTGASQFNEPPAEGFSYIAAKVRARNDGEAALAIDTNDFAMSGSSGVVRRFIGAVAPDPALDAAVQPGETRDGWVVAGAGTDEDNLLLIYDSVTLMGNWADRVFALADGAQISDQPAAAAEPNDAGTSPDQPVGLNGAIVTEDWSVEILEVAYGRDVYNLFPPSDYRTTALGDTDTGSVERWITFRIRVTNNRPGGDQAFLAQTAFLLADAGGNPIPDVLNLTPPSPEASGAYFPGATRDGWVAYELPVDGAALLRFLPYQTDDDPRYLTWGALAETPREPATAGVGATVRTVEEVNLRSGASTDAEIVRTLPAGTELEVTGPAEEGSGYTWYPVKDPATGDTGYVAAEFLETAEES
jgi:hypothetical protein